jgi:hypothetical protein
MISEDDTNLSYSEDEDAVSTSPRVITDPEEWMDRWSRELVILWHGLLDHAQYLGAAVLDKGKFSDFAEFCFNKSSGYPPAA